MDVTSVLSVSSIVSTLHDAPDARGDRDVRGDRLPPAVPGMRMGVGVSSAARPIHLTRASTVAHCVKSIMHIYIYIYINIQTYDQATRWTREGIRDVSLVH